MYNCTKHTYTDKSEKLEVKQMIISKIDTTQRRQKPSFGTTINIKAKQFAPEHDFLLRMKHKVLQIAKGRADVDLEAIDHGKDQILFSVLASRETNTPVGRLIKKLTGESSPIKRISLPQKALRRLFDAQPISRTFLGDPHIKSEPFTKKHEQDFLSQVTFAVRDFQDTSRAYNLNKTSLKTKVMIYFRNLHNDLKYGQAHAR